MSGYYKSKEVYKQYRDSEGNPHITPVRGLYVGGEYTPPYYIDHNITITEITSTKCNAVHYTEESCDLNPAEILKMSSYTTTPVGVVDYTENSTDMTESILKISSYTTTPAEVVTYTTQNSSNEESMLKVSSYTATPAEVVVFSVNKTDLGHDYCISIEEITSTALVIE